MPNTILGVLLRHHYPQKVNDKTKRPPHDVPTTKWQHWYMVGQAGDTMADRVKNDFMARYKWPDNEPDLQGRFEKTLEKCCYNLAKQQLYYLRIYAVQAFYAEIKEEPISFKAAQTMYLEAHEYEQVPFMWVNTDTWSLLSRRWASSEFIQTSQAKRAARLSRPGSVHHGGSCSLTRTQQEMEEKYGRPFSVLEGYAIHAGASREEVANIESTHIPQVTNPRAKEYLEQYRDALAERDGPDVDWLRGPFDAQLMYDCTGGRPHGRFAMADGAIDSESVQFTCTAGAASEFQRAKRQREEAELERQFLEREREMNERMKQRENEIIMQVREEARQEIERASLQRDARQELQMQQMFSYLSHFAQTQPQGPMLPPMTPFNWNNCFGNTPSAYQAAPNVHEATIQRPSDSDSSCGYTHAAALNVGVDGSLPPTVRTGGSENDNNENGNVPAAGRTNGAASSSYADDPFLQQMIDSTVD